MCNSEMRVSVRWLVFCLVVLCAVRSAVAAPEIRWNPVAASGNVVCTPGTGECGETEIILSEGGVTITLFVELSGWDQDQDGDPSLGAYQGTLDFDTLEGGHTSGEGTIPGVDLVPVGYPDRPYDGAFMALYVCGSITRPWQYFDPLSQCSTDEECPGRFCFPRPDFVFYQDTSGCTVSTWVSPYSWSCATTNCKLDPNGGATKFYGGTLLVDVPTGAEGTYNVNFIDDSDFTLLNSCLGPRIPGLLLTPARITIATGRCCSSIGPDTTICEEGLSISECDARAGPTEYAAAEACTGAGVRDCNDNGIPDECDVIALDCNVNRIPDECETDRDDDGVIDDCDGCPTNPDKTSPGECGCGVTDIDSDRDGVPDCNDRCPGMHDLIVGPDCAPPAPAVSEWGILVLLLSLLVGVTIWLRRSPVSHLHR